MATRSTGSDALAAELANLRVDTRLQALAPYPPGDAVQGPPFVSEEQWTRFWLLRNTLRLCTDNDQLRREPEIVDWFTGHAQVRVRLDDYLASAALALSDVCGATQARVLTTFVLTHPNLRPVPCEPEGQVCALTQVALTAETGCLLLDDGGDHLAVHRRFETWAVGLGVLHTLPEVALRVAPQLPKGQLFTPEWLRGQVDPKWAGWRDVVSGYTRYFAARLVAYRAACQPQIEVVDD